MNKIITILAFLFIFHAGLLSDWQKINSFPTTFVNDILISSSTIYVSAGTGVYRSTDGSVTWQLMNNGLSNAQAIQCYQIYVSGTNLYVATVDGIYKSTDGAQNWVKKSDGIFVGNGALYAFCESIYEINGMLITGAYTGIYRSTNGGDNWTATNITGMHIWAKNFTLYNGVYYAARETGNVPGSYKSTDNGVTWQPFSIQSTYLPAITFYNDGPRLYAGTIMGVFLSTNSGGSWTAKNTGLSADPYSSSILRVNNVLITSLKFGGSGMYISYNNGDQWNNFGQGLPFLTEISKVIQLNTKILTGTSDGIYQRNVSELTGITQISSEVPGIYSLRQNYPNPFNPQTKIKFSVAVEGDVKLTLYDLNGREIAVLLNDNLLPGTYEAIVDGNGLSSGTYYYRMSAGSFSVTRKMTLLK